MVSLRQLPSQGWRQSAFHMDMELHFREPSNERGNFEAVHPWCLRRSVFKPATLAYILRL
jgi:hypothetical protein